MYVLDAHSCFGTVVEAVKFQTKKPHGYDPVIVVAIGYPEGQDANKERFRDYTTPADLDKLPRRGDGSPWPVLGGADDFLHFIETDLKPVMEERYPVDRNRQTLMGHSLGGYFTLHVLFTHRNAFSTYISGSPSIWWNDCEVHEAERRFRQELVQEADQAKAAGTAPRQIKLLLSAGELERSNPSRMLDNAMEMADRLAELKEAGLTVFKKEFEGEGHVSVIPALIARGIRVALAKSQEERRQNI